MKPIPFKGRAFVSIFGAIFPDSLETTGAKTWREFFERIYIAGKPLRPLPKASEALDQLETAGYAVALICPASHFLQSRAELFLQDFRDMRVDRNGQPRQVLFKTPHSEVDPSADWVAGMVATQGGALWIGPRSVIEVLKVIAPEVKCYESFWEAVQEGGPLAQFREPNYAA